MFSQLTRYASQLDIEIEDAEMDIRMTYDTRGKLLLEDISPACSELTYVFKITSPAPPEKVQQIFFGRRYRSFRSVSESNFRFEPGAPVVN